MPLDVAEIKWLTIWCDRYVNNTTVHTVGGPDNGTLETCFLEKEKCSGRIGGRTLFITALV